MLGNGITRAVQQMFQIIIIINFYREAHPPSSCCFYAACNDCDVSRAGITCDYNLQCGRRRISLCVCGLVERDLG